MMDFNIVNRSEMFKAIWESQMVFFGIFFSFLFVFLQEIMEFIVILLHIGFSHVFEIQICHSMFAIMVSMFDNVLGANHVVLKVLVLFTIAHLDSRVIYFAIYFLSTGTGYFIVLEFIIRHCHLEEFDSLSMSQSSIVTLMSCFQVIISAFTLFLLELSSDYIQTALEEKDWKYEDC